MRYSPNNKFELIELLNQNQAKIKSFGVNRLDLFGSFQTNSTTIESDIDFIVEFKQGEKTYDNFIELAFFLEASPIISILRMMALESTGSLTTSSFVLFLEELNMKSASSKIWCNNSILLNNIFCLFQYMRANVFA